MSAPFPSFLPAFLLHLLARLFPAWRVPSSSSSSSSSAPPPPTPPAEHCPFAALGLRRPRNIAALDDAAQEELLKSVHRHYRQLSRTYHPDKNVGRTGADLAACTQSFQRLGVARAEIEDLVGRGDAKSPAEEEADDDACRRAHETPQETRQRQRKERQREKKREKQAKCAAEKIVPSFPTPVPVFRLLPSMRTDTLERTPAPTGTVPGPVFFGTENVPLLSATPAAACCAAPDESPRLHFLLLP